MSEHRNSRNGGLQLGWLIAGLLALVAFVSSVHPQAVSKVESVGFTVSDMDRAVDFYTRVLTFEKISDTELWGGDLERLTGVFGARVRVVRMRLGSEVIELTEYLASSGRPVPVDSRSNDRWFQHVAIIVSDIDKAYAVLRAHKVKHASTGPQTLPAYIAAAAGIRAFYFKDPDDHVLEILSFPPDKGLAKWHAADPGGRLFLGIDHTAIVVNDSEQSLKFYRDLLGLNVAGTSDNYGTEQEHLNNVRGAKLHITGLRTREDGIAVEFLEYREPRDGRPFPADTRSSDLWNWQTSFVGGDPIGFFERFKGPVVSDGLVRFAEPQLGFRYAGVVRDPDGHAVRIVQ